MVYSLFYWLAKLRKTKTAGNSAAQDRQEMVFIRVTGLRVSSLKAKVLKSYAKSTIKIKQLY